MSPQLSFCIPQIDYYNIRVDSFQSILIYSAMALHMTPWLIVDKIGDQQQQFMLQKNRCPKKPHMYILSLNTVGISKMRIVMF